MRLNASCRVWLSSSVLLGCADAGSGSAGAADVTLLELPEGPSADALPSAREGDQTRPDVPPTDVPPNDLDAPAPLTLRVVTFNTGTAIELAHDGPPDDGFSSAQAELIDEWFGNGLSWTPFVEATAAWFLLVDPDIVAFQEIFWPGECPTIPEDARLGTVCENWKPGDPSVAERLVGPDYAIACHPGKPDKCLAVHHRVGTLVGCPSGLCLDSLEGYPITGCGSGVRVARGVLQPADGGAPITLISFHGSSGFSEGDLVCRTQQVARVFDDFGDGAPGLVGGRNIVLGDLNTDPGRLADSDPSAAAWWEQANGPDARLRFISDVGVDAPATYAGFLNIDHVLSDAFGGGCTAAGHAEEVPAVMGAVFFDHLPQVCELSETRRLQW